MPLTRGSGGFRVSARAFWHTALAAIVVGGFCMWQVVFTGSGTAAADSTSWVPGTATATAQALAFSPSTAGLNYALTFATSVADFQANEGQAQSQIVTGGPLVTALTSVQCNGSAPLVTNSQLPQAAVAESTNGNQSSANDLTQQYANSAGTVIGAGVERASATTQPAATATTKLVDFNVAGAFDISGIQSSAYAQQITGQLRQATSTVDIGQLSLGGGAVALNGLHWDDTQETGPGGAITKQSGSFTIGGISIAGVSLPTSLLSTDTIAQLLGIVNTALEGTGFHISLPVASANSSDGTESVSPLAIGLDQSALGQQVVGPLLGQTETVRDELDNILENQISCQTGTPITVADILIGALAGGGNLDLNLGGATATSNGTAYANPFGNALGLLGAAGSALSNLTGGLGIAGSAGTYTPGTPGTGGTSGANPKRSLGTLSSSSRCLTTSPFGHPGCSSGAAFPVALIGLGVVMGVGAADYVRLRRFRRIAPGDVSVTDRGAK
jgi:hypothetical protein